MSSCWLAVDITTGRHLLSLLVLVVVSFAWHYLVNGWPKLQTDFRCITAAIRRPGLVEVQTSLLTAHDMVHNGVLLELTMVDETVAVHTLNITEDL